MYTLTDSYSKQQPDNLNVLNGVWFVYIFFENYIENIKET
jgi:hypothetical protein